MGEGIRHDIALRPLLDAVVADGAGRAERLVDIAGLDDVLGLMGPVGPDAGKAIGLQLHAHLQRIGLPLPHLRLRPLHLPA